MKRVLVNVALAFLVLGAGQGGFAVSALDATVAPHRWGLVEWEVTHFLDKWKYRIREALPWHRPPAEEEGLLKRFFSLSLDIEELERQLVTVQGGGSSSTGDLTDIQEELKALRKYQSRIKPQAEERLEGLVSAWLADEGFKSSIGLIWPPVDVELISPPTVLILSPRAVIESRETINLRPNLKVEDKETLEDRVFQEQDLSALVVDIGGIATYPSIVPPASSLRHALITTVHEWLHQYWFFRPLGWNYWRDSNTTTLNETAADLAGRELGERIYEALAGVETKALVQVEEPGEEPEDRFNFREEMHRTRLQADRLLAEGKVEEAETYMEERRRVFVENGFFIRKLNQAYFAFLGTYASNPASVSPINEELERFRALVDTVGDFIREVSQFSSYQEFKAHLQDMERTSLPTTGPQLAGISLPIASYPTPGEVG